MDCATAEVSAEGEQLASAASGRSLLLLPGVSALMLPVGVLAALGSARRGLAVEPVEVLREE